MSRIKEAIELLSNRFIGLEDPPAQEALETVYEAAKNGEIKQCPCQGKIKCHNGQEATIFFPNSHTLTTDRGEINILGLGQKTRRESQ